jgi:hypothetical protein
MLDIMHKGAYASICISVRVLRGHPVVRRGGAVVIETETALAKLRAISKTSAFNEWLGLEVTATRFIARGKILKLGKRQIFCRAEVYSDDVTDERLVASGETILMVGS